MPEPPSNDGRSFVTGRDEKQVKWILREIATHLQYLNETCGRLHGDLKPRNVVQPYRNNTDAGGKELAWTLIDLDAGCKIGEDADQKETST